MRCEEKIPGGKLFCLEFSVMHGKTINVKITGDFFLHPEDRIIEIEHAMDGLEIATPEHIIESKVLDALGDAQLIGASPADLARIFKKVVALE